MEAKVAAQPVFQVQAPVPEPANTAVALSRLGTPTLVMTYWNPIDRYGVERFAADLANAGGAGLITPGGVV